MATWPYHPDVASAIEIARDCGVLDLSGMALRCIPDEVSSHRCFAYANFCVLLLSSAPKEELLDGRREGWNGYKRRRSVVALRAGGTWGCPHHVPCSFLVIPIFVISNSRNPTISSVCCPLFRSRVHSHVYFVSVGVSLSSPSALSSSLLLSLSLSVSISLSLSLKSSLSLSFFLSVAFSSALPLFLYTGALQHSFIISLSTFRLSSTTLTTVTTTEQ